MSVAVPVGATVTVAGRVSFAAPVDSGVVLSARVRIMDGGFGGAILFEHPEVDGHLPEVDDGRWGIHGRTLGGLGI